MSAYKENYWTIIDPNWKTLFLVTLKNVVFCNLENEKPHFFSVTE